MTVSRPVIYDTTHRERWTRTAWIACASDVPTPPASGAVVSLGKRRGSSKL